MRVERKAGPGWQSEFGSIGTGAARMPAASGRRFKPNHRLRKAEEFDAVFAFRRRLSSPHFQLSYRPNGGRSARLGLVVAKKNAVRAVARNLIRRICRESFRSFRESLPRCDIVLRLSAPLQRMDTAQLRSEIDALMARFSENVSRGSG